MPNQIKPEDRRARTVTTAEGKFLSLKDFKKALNDDAFVNHCMTMLVVGQRLGHPPVESCRKMIGLAVLTLSGEEAELMARLNQERKGKA